MQKLSVVIPARDEAACIAETVRNLTDCLRKARIEHEIVVVDDNSIDDTSRVLAMLAAETPSVRHTASLPPHGVGLAIRKGFESCTGDAVAVYMADGSDRPADLVRFFRTMQEMGVDCVFGSRFDKGATVVNYPFLKLLLNRLGNFLIRILFGLRYNDISNAFKLYSRQTVEGVQPILSHHFNITVELPLKAIVRGYSYTVLPNDWTNRATGISKLKIKEMGSRYLFIVLYCLMEKWLSKGDYRRHRPLQSPVLRRAEALLSDRKNVPRSSV
ncbi:MAG: glycosyltransferase [Burkholderiales bacterium]|nr:glycosyltransferase [Burkholderiales bacterium]